MNTPEDVDVKVLINGEHELEVRNLRWRSNVDGLLVERPGPHREKNRRRRERQADADRRRRMFRRG
jgi:hypothetical protein